MQIKTTSHCKCDQIKCESLTICISDENVQEPELCWLKCKEKKGRKEGGEEGKKEGKQDGRKDQSYKENQHLAFSSIFDLFSSTGNAFLAPIED